MRHINAARRLVLQQKNENSGLGNNYENQFAQASDAFHSIEYSAHSRHFIMADDPQWLNERIKSFLSSLASERR